MNWRSERHILVILGIVYLVLFTPLLGISHLFDWDEINFAEAAREMLATGDWLNVQIGYEPFWEKPPLFIWMQALSMKLFGVNEFAARLPNVAVGLITLLFIYHVACRHYGRQAAIASVLLYMGSLTPHLYFKSGIIDPTFNLLIILGIYMLLRSMHARRKALQFLYSGLFFGLAVLTKGPVALLIAGLVGLSYQLIYRHNFYRLYDLAALLLGLVATAGLWLLAQIQWNGTWFLGEFIRYQIELFQQPVASHGQPFYYHALVLLLACFPLTILALPSLRMRWKRSSDDLVLSWMRITFWVVLILFSLVTTKIVHYSSLCYIPMSILAGEWLVRRYRLALGLKIGLLAVTSLWSAALFALVFLQRTMGWKDKVGEKLDAFSAAKWLVDVDWGLQLYVFPLAWMALVIYTLYRYSKAKLMTYLIGHSLFISILLSQLVPRIEQHTQSSWVAHLESYAGRPMFHFTLGFKSYAHHFYTRLPYDTSMQSIKLNVLKTMGEEDYYGMDAERRKAFDVALRHHVLQESDLPFSLSARLRDKPMLDSLSALQQVFEGNGYVVYERRPLSP